MNTIFSSADDPEAQRVVLHAITAMCKEWEEMLSGEPQADENHIWAAVRELFSSRDVFNKTLANLVSKKKIRCISSEMIMNLRSGKTVNKPKKYTLYPPSKNPYLPPEYQEEEE